MRCSESSQDDGKPVASGRFFHLELNQQQVLQQDCFGKISV